MRPFTASVRTVVPALLVALSALPLPVAAQDRDPPSRTLEAGRVVGEPPRIDGRIEDAAWKGAAQARGFSQLTPNPGNAARLSTVAWLVYDDEAVYVALRMDDPAPSEIAAQLGRRDASGIYSDWAHVLIDSYHDRRTGFRFSVNPAGVQKDVLHHDDTSEDINWDAVWEAATRIDDAGWTAELRIPLSQLRFNRFGEAGCVARQPATGERPAGEAGPGGSSAGGPSGDADPARAGAARPTCEGMVWGINFGRDIARFNESSWWAPLHPDVAGVVSRAGELRGLVALQPPRRLEAAPYVAAQARQEPVAGGDPFRSGSGRSGILSFGGDVEYGVTSNLTLSGTINPDFGQVEADPSVVNLTADEVFFEERRPFFVEGANIFGFDIGFNDDSGEGLFYTRRVGRNPQRSLDGEFVDVPATTTILGAAKLSGRTAGGWSVGALDALTAEEVGAVALEDGTVHERVVEPLTNYAVLRASRDFREGRSTTGLMLTGTHRSLDGTGIDFLADRAWAGGADFRHRFAADTWDLNGWAAASHVSGSAESIDRLQRSPLRFYHRPDADHLEYDPTATSLAGYAGALNLWKVSGSWRGGLGGTFRSPGFEVNDAGFQTAADLAIIYGNLRYHRFEPIGPFRNWRVGINPSASWDFGGTRAHSQFNFFGGAELTNDWNFGWWSARQLPATSTGALRGGPAIRRPGAWRGNVWINTDSRRAVQLNAWTSFGVEDQDSGWYRNTGVGLTWRPSGRVDLAVSPSLVERSTEWQYVDQVDDLADSRRYVFAPLHQRTLSVTTRLSYTFTPTLSLQLYAQPFVSAGSYTGFREVTDPRARAFADRFHTFTDDELSLVPGPDGGTYQVDRDGDGTPEFGFGRPDFNFAELRSNLVLRWEYRPGSTLFVVWSQGRNRSVTTGTFDPIDDFDRLLSDADGSNTLAVKVNYWVSL